VPVLALVAHAYAAELKLGQALSFQVRDWLFERGLDVSEPDTLTAIARSFGLGSPDPDDYATVVSEWKEGRRRHVAGSRISSTPRRASSARHCRSRTTLKAGVGRSKPTWVGCRPSSTVAFQRKRRTPRNQAYPTRTTSSNSRHLRIHPADEALARRLGQRDRNRHRPSIHSGTTVGGNDCIPAGFGSGGGERWTPPG
jgi:hypothetical protein